MVVLDVPSTMTTLSGPNPPPLHTIPLDLGTLTPVALLLLEEVVVVVNNNSCPKFTTLGTLHRRHHFDMCPWNFSRWL